MGNPSIKINGTSVIVDGFFFNVGMTVFREQFGKRREDSSLAEVVPRLCQHIEKRGYEHIMDTILHLDEFVATEADRSDLIRWLRELTETVLSPGFQLPELWQKALSGKFGGSAPIPITRDHFIGIAYVYQIMIDLIEGRIQEKLVRRLRPPPDWSPPQ